MDTNLTHEQIQYAIGSLRNLLNAGVVHSEALREMQYLQPRFAEFWADCSHHASRGRALSETLRPILDEATYGAIAAAEHTGTLEAVFSRLYDAMEERRQIRKLLRKMYYPLIALVGAVGVFILYVAFVVPTLSRSMARPGQKDTTTLTTITSTANEFFVAYWPHLTVFAVALIATAVLWLRDRENRNTILSILDRIPVLGPASRDLYYGEWATHMAINTHAGITVPDALTLTRSLLPAFYQPEILAVAKDITRIGQAAAAAPKEGDDPRNRLPFLIVNAFRFADRTGIADTNFQAAAKALIEQGKLRIEQFVSTVENILVPLTAILGASAIIPYFMQMGNAFSHIR